MVIMPPLISTEALLKFDHRSGKDGFIITAFLTSDVKDLERREKLWPSLF